MDLRNKIALTAGGTGGIGMASAIEMSKQGASIILLARNEEKLKATLIKLDSSQGQNHSYLVADFSKENSLNAVCEKIKKLKIDIAIANAAVKKAKKNIDAMKSDGLDESAIEASGLTKKLNENEAKVTALQAQLAQLTPSSTSTSLRSRR